MSSLTDPLGPDLKATLRALKLGKLTATLPERLTLARQHNMPHADFLQLILSDEVARREAGSIALRARNAGLDPAMRTRDPGTPPPSATTSSYGTSRADRSEPRAAAAGLVHPEVVTGRQWRHAPDVLAARAVRACSRPRPAEKIGA